MSRLTIDTGTAGNPATGDSLRTAFNKVNTNFTELYAELGGDSLDAISFTNNTISTDITNANLILTGNGTGGVVIEDIEITGSTVNVLTTNNNLTLNTNGTGKVVINGLSFPTTDGTAGQVLKTDGAGNLSFTDSASAQGITFVGDDSTGTRVSDGESFKIAGGTGLTSVVSGDTITLDIDSTVATLTGSQELTNKTLTTPKIDLIKDANGNEVLGFSTTASATDYLVVKNGIGVGSPIHIYAEGDSANIGVHLQPKGSGIFTISDGTDFNKGIRFRSSSSAASAITLIDAVSTAGRVVTLPDATDTLVGRATQDTLTNKSISLTTNTITGTVVTLVGDDSTGTTLNIGETFKIAGTSNITTAVSGDTLTITGSKNIEVNEISSGDSSAIQINDAINVSGLLTANAGLTINNNSNTWQFGSTGALTVPANGIITAPINQEFQLQAKDTNSVLRNEINLDPNNGTYMSVWRDGTTSFSSADWGSGSWNNESGLGAARFTDAQGLQNFWLTGPGSIEGVAIEASINGGARTPNVFYENNNGETYGVYLGLDAVPPGGQGTTVPITSIVFYYRLQSKINMDVTGGGEILLDAQAMDIDLRTTLNLDLRANENLNLRGLGQYPVRIYTNGITHKWEFDNTGSLTLPREGKIYGVGDGGPGGDRLGYISWDGNSSGDGSGFNTMRLVPDLTGLEAADQYIILDPTGGAPGHIHIRAGGTQDNSGAHLFLGGEHSHVKISAGLNPPVTVMANDNSWTFGTDGTLTFPDSTTQNTAARITIVGDDSTGVTLNAGETIKIAGTQNITTAVSGDTLTITGPNLSSYLTSVPSTIEINQISSADSTAIQINDAVNVSGAGTFHGSVRFNAGYTEKINALTSSSTITVNCATASIHTVTLAVSTGFVISNLPTGGTVTLIITQGGSGSYTATFGTDGSTTVKFPGGAPTLSTAVGAIDVVTIFNDGTNYLGNIAKAYAA
jgi:hypothetical protein